MQRDCTETYDVIVIGAGISGLTSAALLSKAGLKVCVLEKNFKPGGYLAKMEKDGFTFDTAIHWLNNCHPKGFVTKIFKIVGKDYPVANSQKNIKRFLGENFNYLLTNNPEELKRQLIEDYPEDEKNIERFFNAAKKIYRNLDKFNKIMRSGETMSFLEKLKHHINRFKFAIHYVKYVGFTGKKGKTKGINLFFKANILHEIFANESDLLSCLIPVGWAYNNDFQKPPEGGSNNFIQWLEYVVNFFGNQIICNAEAEKINIINNRCKSIIYQRKGHKHEVFCSQIIAACDMEQLYGKMLSGQTNSYKILKKLEKADIYSSAFIIYISLDCPAEELGFNEEMVSIINAETDGSQIEISGLNSCEIAVFSQSARDKSLVPPGHGSLTIMMPAYYTSNNRWQTEIDDKGNIKRGEKYKALKTKYAEALISKVEEKIGIDLRKHILQYEAATPITLWRYSYNKHGSMMGLKPGGKNILSGLIHYKTFVKGLYMSGHWSEPGGGVPIAVKSSVNTVLLVLKERDHKAFKIITKYLDDKISIEEVLKSGAFLNYDDSWS